MVSVSAWIWNLKTPLTVFVPKMKCPRASWIEYAYKYLMHISCASGLPFWSICWLSGHNLTFIFSWSWHDLTQVSPLLLWLHLEPNQDCSPTHLTSKLKIFRPWTNSGSLLPTWSEGVVVIEKVSLISPLPHCPPAWPPLFSHIINELIELSLCVKL